MNEISKYRAWHTEEKLMCKIDCLTNRGAFLLGVKKGEDTVYKGGKSIVLAPDKGRFCPFSDIVLMRFTGVIDGNGKKIYTGDIVDHSISETQHYKGIVGFDAPSFVIHTFHTKEQTLKGETCYEGNSRTTHALHTYKIEVLGNVFENKDLLPAHIQLVNY